MSNVINQGIQKIQISKRYSDCNFSFVLTFIPPSNNNITPISTFDYGEEVQFNIADVGNPDGFSIVSGKVQKIKTDSKQNNIIQTVTGRSIGFLLTRQPFNWDCTIAKGKSYTTEQLLEIILEDTGIKIGRGQTKLNHKIKYSTQGVDTGKFCGKFNNKKDAIDQLFAQYVHLSDSKKIRWFVDSGGYLRWFEILTDRTNKILFFKDDGYVKDNYIEGNAENIINDITVTGGDQSDIVVHLTDEYSIKKFGRQVGSPINNTKLRSSTEVEEVAQKELSQKSMPFYQATLELEKYYSIDSGQQVQFPDYPGHENRIFTVTDIDVTEEPANVTTKVSLTTDETVISVVNEMDVIETVSAVQANGAKAIEAVCMGVDPNDPTKILFKAKGSDTVQSARTTSIKGSQPIIG